MPFSQAPGEHSSEADDVHSTEPSFGEVSLPDYGLSDMLEEILEARGPNGDPDVPIWRKPDPNRPAPKEYPPLAVPGMLDEPLQTLDDSLKAAEETLPELAQSITALAGSQLNGPAPKTTPDQLGRQSTAIAELEEKCAGIIAEFAEVGEQLIETFRNALNTARYMAEEGADPHLAWWKKALNKMVPYGGTKRVINSAIGATSFLATMIASGLMIYPELAAICAPLYALSASLAAIPVVGVVLDWIVAILISLAAVSIPTAIASVITGGLATYGYGGVTLAWDKYFSKENDAVKAWIQNLNASFAGAKDRTLSGFAELEEALRKLADLRDNIPSLCTDARAACARRAKETGRDAKEWEEEDAEFVEQSQTSQQSAHREKAVLKLLHMLQHLTDVVQPIDPLSKQDLSTRGFQGLLDICRVIEKLGKIHFFFPGGRPAKDSRIWRSIYDWLGVAAGPVARFGAFLQALTIDGERPFRMLHELLGAILEQARLKNRRGVTTGDMISAAFDDETWEQHGWQHWWFGGVADGVFAYGLKTIPLIERANERRKFSPDSARMEVRKKIGDKTWRTQAAKSTGRKIAGIVGDAFSIGGSAIVGGVRRLFFSRSSRLQGDENNCKNAVTAAQAELTKAFPAFAKYDALSNAQLRDSIRREVKAMPPNNDQAAERVSVLIDYWEKREEVEDLQSRQLAAGHRVQLDEIDPLLPRLLERLNGSRGLVSTNDTLRKINANLRNASRMPGVEKTAESDTIIGSTRQGSLLVLRSVSAPGVPSPRTLSIISSDQVQSFIQRHVTEKKSLPSVLLSDEATVLLMAQYAAGGGPLTAAQRDALLQAQIGGDPAAVADLKLQSLFSKYQYEGFEGPDGRTVVPGFRTLSAALRGRNGKSRRTSKSAWLADV